MFKYAGIKYNDCVDGEGVCVSLWMQGCPHRCFNCHNPETWSFDGGNYYTKDVEKKMIEGIGANGIQRNFSILGGEPLAEENILLTSHIVHKVRRTYPNIKIYIWTGFTYEELIDDKVAYNIFSQADVLIDGRYIDAQRDLTLKLRGSRNQRVIDLKESLKTKSVVTLD